MRFKAAASRASSDRVKAIFLSIPAAQIERERGEGKKEQGEEKERERDGTLKFMLMLPSEELFVCLSRQLSLSQRKVTQYSSFSFRFREISVGYLFCSFLPFNLL